MIAQPNEKLPKINHVSRVIFSLFLAGTLLAITIEIVQLRSNLANVGPDRLEPVIATIETPAQIAVEKFHRGLSNQIVQGVMLTGYVSEAIIYDDFNRILAQDVEEFESDLLIDALTKILNLNVRQIIEKPIITPDGKEGRLYVEANYQRILKVKFFQAITRLTPLFILDLVVWLLISRYLTTRLVKTVEGISHWSRQCSIGKNVCELDDLALRYLEFQKLARQLYLSFSEQFEHRRKLSDLNIAQGNILSAVSYSLSASQIFCSMHDASGKHVFSNLETAPESQVKFLLRNQYHDPYQMIVKLERRGATVQEYSNRESGKRSRDKNKQASLIVKFKSEVWQVNWYMSENSVSFVSIMDLANLEKVQSENFNHYRKRLESESLLAAIGKHAIYLKHASSGLVELQKSEGLTREVRHDLNQLLKQNELVISSMKNISGGAIFAEESVEPVNLGNWLADNYPMMQAIISEQIRIDLRCAEDMTVLIHKATLGTIIMGVLSQILYSTVDIGIISIFCRPVSDSEVLQASDLNIGKNYIALSININHPDPSLGIAMKNELLQKQWNEQCIKRDDAIWNLKSIVQKIGGKFNFYYDEYSQNVEIYIPIENAFAPRKSSIALSTQTINASGKNVLIVHDVHSKAEEFASALNQTGKVAFICHSVRQANYELRKVNDFDAVFVKATLKDGKGEAIIEYAKSVGVLHSVLIVNDNSYKLSSNFVDEIVYENGCSAGVVARPLKY